LLRRGFTGLPWNTERNCSPKLLPKRFQSKLNEVQQGLPRLEPILSVQTALQWHSSRLRFWKTFYGVVGDLSEDDRRIENAWIIPNLWLSI
jgi:hypothetical protein